MHVSVRNLTCISVRGHRLLLLLTLDLQGCRPIKPQGSWLRATSGAHKGLLSGDIELRKEPEPASGDPGSTFCVVPAAQCCEAANASLQAVPLRQAHKAQLDRYVLCRHACWGLASDFGDFEKLCGLRGCGS